jgi:universal stress protein A
MTAKKILFCTDFSVNSVPARQKAMVYAAALGAELLVLHVIGSGNFGYPSFEDTLGPEMTKLREKIDERVQQEMNREAKECRQVVKEVSTFLRSGQPAEEIVRFARKHDVDLIVLGTHGWGVVKQRILGSTAMNVARTAACPVMAVRAPARA